MDDDASAPIADEQNRDSFASFEFEETTLRPTSIRRQRWRTGLIAVTILILLGLTLALAANDTTGIASNNASAATHQASAVSTSVVISTAALVVATPPATAFAPAPNNCPGNATHPQQLSYFAMPAFGLAPIWLSGLAPEQNGLTVHFEQYPPLLYTASGWRWRILLVSAPGYAGLLTLSGQQQFETGKDNSLLLDDGGGLTAQLALNAQAPVMQSQLWAEWPIYVYLPGPGCYKLTAQWPGASLTLNFAAGV